MLPSYVWPMANAICAGLPAHMPVDQLSEESRAQLAKRLALISIRADERTQEFTAIAPERKVILAESVALANAALSEVLSQGVAPAQQQPTLQVGPGWAEAGQAAGQLLGFTARIGVELLRGIVVGTVSALFAPRRAAPKQVRMVDLSEPYPLMPSKQVEVNVNVTVNVK